jgi:hypothetical protein
MALKEKVTTTRKNIAEGNSIRSHSCLATHERLLSFYFVIFFFSFSPCPSLLTKIGFGYFHNRLKNIFLSEQKRGKITLDGSVDCRGLAHTLSLCHFV